LGNKQANEQSECSPAFNPECRYGQTAAATSQDFSAGKNKLVEFFPPELSTCPSANSDLSIYKAFEGEGVTGGKERFVATSD